MVFDLVSRCFLGPSSQVHFPSSLGSLGETELEQEARLPDVEEKVVKPASLEEEKAVKLSSLEVRDATAMHLKLV